MKQDGPGKTPDLPERIRDLLSSMGLSAEFRPVPDNDSGGWGRYRFVRTDGSEPPYPVFLFEHKVKPVQEAKRQVSNLFHCVALFSLRSGYHLFLKSASSSLPFTLDSADACEQAGTALSAAGFASAGGKSRMMLAIRTGAYSSRPSRNGRSLPYWPLRHAETGIIAHARTVCFRDLRAYSAPPQTSLNGLLCIVLYATCNWANQHRLCRDVINGSGGSQIVPELQDTA